MADTPPPTSTPAPAPAPKPAPVEPAPPAHELPPVVHPAHEKLAHQVAFTAHPKLLYAWPLILVGFVFWWPGRPPEMAAATAKAPETGIRSAGPGEAALPTAKAPATTQPVTTSATSGAAAALLAQSSTPSQSALLPARPLSATGQAAALPARPYSQRLEYLGWAYIWIALIVVLALGIDLGRNQALVLVLFIAFVWVLGVLLRDKYHFTLFGDIYRWFGERHVQYDHNLALCLSIILLFPYLFMLIWARLNDRWRITHNEFEHYSLGRSVDSLGRGAKAIRSEYPDFFEAVLGLGAGTLIVSNASGTRELRRIPNVILLPIVRKKLEQILARTAVTAAQTEDEEDDEQQ